MQSKLLVIGLVVLSVACAGLIAWICVLTGQPVWYAAAPVLLFLFVLLALWAVSVLSARMGAARLEKGLMAQAEQQAKSARPDQKQHVVGLQRDFEKAVRELKGSRIGRAGRDALYLLPWYAIIGPSGAGKTTALRNSGLRFPNMRGGENVKVKGVGGTRNCDFWLTNDAVLLDTAGRWSTQEDDHHEWLSFLQLLRKHRAKKPLNGMIAAIGIGDVVNASADDIDLLAERMRARLEEVVNELRVSIPIYVLFTKCDLLEGFIEMFGGLRATEREQILGFTVPLSRSGSSPEQLFEDYFDELADNLRGASLARMGEERGARARQRVYVFPEQFQAMRDNLTRFMTRLFENNVYRETVPLRGVYFSSGTQEGRPFNLLFEPSKSNEAPIVDQKGYFLRDLFMQVVFADSAIASASQAELKRQRMVQMGLTGALSVVTLTAGVIPASVFMRSRHQIGVTTDLVEEAERDALKATRREVGYSSTARNLFADLNRYEKGGPSFLTTMGMYTGDRVVPSLRRYMATLLRRELVQPLVSSEAQAMTDFGLRFEAQPRQVPSPPEHDMYYTALKLHLLLTMQQMPQQYAKWVEERLSERWKDANVEGATPQLAATYVDWAQLYPELAFTQDAAMVRRVRAALNRTSAAQQTLDAIISHVSSLGYDIDLPKLTGYNSALSGSRKVRGAFTRRGYETVRELFDTGAPEHVDELWVLGLTEAAGAGDRAARLAELESLYFRAYVQEWRGFVEGVHTREARGSTAEALALLRELTSGVPTPMGRVFQGVANNVRLPLPKPDAKQEVVDKAKQVAQQAAQDTLTGIWTRNSRGVPAPKLAKNSKPERIIDRFGAGDLAAAFDGFVSFGVATDTGEDRSAARGPVPFDTYREQLTYLRDALQLRLDNPGEDKQLEGKITQAMVQVRGLIESQPPQWRPVFESLLWPPIKGLREKAVAENTAWMGGRWCSDVVAPFEQSLMGRYPFNANGRDARIEDVEAYYKPGEGLIWKFINTTLRDQVQLQGDKYTFTARNENGQGPYNENLLEFLDRSHAISRSLYAAGGSPKVDFAVRLHGASSKVDTITMMVGGKTISYDNGPLTWQNLSWPGPEPTRGASFMVKGRTIRAGNDIEGVWGLWRLLETGAVSRASDDAISITWRLPTDDVAVWIELRPAVANSPFFDRDDRQHEPKLLRLLRGSSVPAPRRIAASQPVCKP